MVFKKRAFEWSTSIDIIGEADLLITAEYRHDQQTDLSLSLFGLPYRLHSSSTVNIQHFIWSLSLFEFAFIFHTLYICTVESKYHSLNLFSVSDGLIPILDLTNSQ